MVAQRRGEAAADGDVLQDFQRILNRADALRVGAVDVLRGAGRCLRTVKALLDQTPEERRDNERFVRLVDSGEWGRGRVEELSEAGRLLKDERKQLEDLIRSIKDEKGGKSRMPNFRRGRRGRSRTGSSAARLSSETS